MSHDAIAPDVSYYQKPVNNRFRRQWLIFRACDGTFRDPNFPANYAWCVKATARRMIYPKLKGFTVYVVYRPGVDVLRVLQAMCPTPHPKMTVMIDVESWGSAIRGDHSQEITHLANELSIWLHGNSRVLAYGNQNDLANIYPHRPSWLRLIVAGYSTVQPQTPGLIGWQYTDGSDKWPHPAGLPVSSAPFGRCDHNVFPGLTPVELAQALGVTDPPQPAPTPAPTNYDMGPLLEAIMTLDRNSDEYKALVHDIADAVVTEQITVAKGKRWSVRTTLASIWSNAHKAATK